MTAAVLDLEVTDLSVRYGGVSAVERVSVEVPNGAIVAVLGANGAGKSSTLNAIAGNSVGSVTGRVGLFGESVLGRPSHALVGRGLTMVPEGRQIIAPLSVEENLRLGAYHRRARKAQGRLLAEVYELFPILQERRGTPGGVLSGGEQQMLALGRAMMTDPRLIVMDEPSMGLSPAMVQRVMEAIVEINRVGKSILLVEQNAVASLGVAHIAYVMEQGRIVLHGSADEVRNDGKVAEAFLGLTGADTAPQERSRESATATPGA